MLLEINDHKTIRALQQEFAMHYPFLKIVFFDKPHEMLEASTGPRVPVGREIGTLRVMHHSGTLEINPQHTAWHIEKHFRDRYGLYVQIYRRKRRGWEQTAGSDLITLKEQNEIGRAAVESGYFRETREFQEDEY